MTLQTSLIPNLLQGVSQQADSQRDPSQGEIQINGMSSAGEGLRKREGSRPIARVSTAALGDALFHQIQRDSAEQYLVVITKTGIRVFDLAGGEKVVTAASGAFSYLASVTTPRSDIRAATIADTTFISNLKVLPAMLASLSPATSRPAAFEALIWVKAANYGQTYRASVNGVQVEVQTNVQPVTVSATATTENRISTAEIAAQIRGNLLGGAISTISTTASSTTLNGTQTLEPTTTDQGGSGLMVNITANGTAITSVVINPASVTRGYQAGDAIFVPRNRLQGGTDITPVRVATVTAAAAGPLTGVAINRSGSVLHLTSSAAFTVSASDARAGADITAITDTVQAFTDLPQVAPVGYPIEVTGDPSNQFDSFYLSFTPRDGAGTFGEGEWAEAVATGVKYRPDPSTMPHLLIRLPSGSFWFGPANGSVQSGFQVPTWGERTAGDEDSAPDPAFIGAPVQDACVFGNRLTLLADEGAALSRARAFFDFFPETVTTVSDNDPIGISSPDAERVSVLRFAIPYQNELICFSDQLAFRLYRNDTILSPKTAELAVLTALDVDTGCRPVPVQGEIVFIQANGQFSRMRNFAIRGAGTAIIANAGDLTEQAASYIPSGITRLAQSDAANAVFAISSKAGFEKRIYVYKYFLRGTERIQSSVSYWELSGADKILDIICVKEVLYLLAQYGTEVWLERMSISDRISDASPSPYPFLMDRCVSTTTSTPAQVRVPVGVYSPASDSTTWTLPFSIKARTQAWTGYTAAVNGGVLLGEASSGNLITARGDWATGAPPIWFGEVVPFRYRFSRFRYLREQPGGKAPPNYLQTNVRSVGIRYENTRFFRVVVQAEGRAPIETVHNAMVLGVRDSALGSTLPADGFDPSVFSGVLRVPVHSDGAKCWVEIQNDSPHPSQFSSAEWAGVISGRARAIQ